MPIMKRFQGTAYGQPYMRGKVKLKFAVIDIGSNTVKLNVFEYNNGFCTLSERDIVRGGLAKYKNNGVMDDEGIKVILSLLADYKDRLLCGGVYKIFPYATESLRGISNADDVCASVREKLGLIIDIIDGETEARCGFEAFRTKYPDAENGILVDMGGGSTEITCFDGQSIDFSRSMRFGSLSLRRRFSSGMIPSSKESGHIALYFSKALDYYGVKPYGKILYSSGGTSNGMLQLYEKLYHTDEQSIQTSGLSAMCAKLRCGKSSVKKLLKAELPDRYDSIMCGLYAYLSLCECLGIEKIVPVKSNAREGYAVMLIKKGVIC